MKRPKPSWQHNYIRKLHYLFRIGAIPPPVDLHLVSVFHDDWCGIYQEKRCNCEPDIRLNASVPGTLN